LEKEKAKTEEFERQGKDKQLKELLKEKGITGSIDNLLKTGTLSDAESEMVLEFRAGKRKEEELPISIPKNPEGRAEKTAENYKNAPTKTSIKKTLTIRVSKSIQDAKTYLKTLNRNNDHLFCQMCDQEMPVKKRNGEYYFEAVQLFDDEFEQETHEICLALCPNCAAKYRLLVKNHEESRDAFKDALLSGEENLQFSIDLHDPNLDPLSIRFTKIHLLDIQTVLAKES